MGKIITGEARSTIFNIHQYFVKEAEKFKRIENGYFQKVQHRVTKAAGVSRAFVSMLLNEKDTLGSKPFKTPIPSRKRKIVKQIPIKIGGLGTPPILSKNLLNIQPKNRRVLITGLQMPPPLVPIRASSSKNVTELRTATSMNKESQLNEAKTLLVPKETASSINSTDLETATSVNKKSQLNEAQTLLVSKETVSSVISTDLETATSMNKKPQLNDVPPLLVPLKTGSSKNITDLCITTSINKESQLHEAPPLLVPLKTGSSKNITDFSMATSINKESQLNEGKTLLVPRETISLTNNIDLEVTTSINKESQLNEAQPLLVPLKTGSSKNITNLRTETLLETQKTESSKKFADLLKNMPRAEIRLVPLDLKRYLNKIPDELAPPMSVKLKTNEDGLAPISINNAMKIGENYSSYEELMAALNAYKNKVCNEYWVRDARTIPQQARRHPSTVNKVNESLKYYYIRYSCVKGGRHFKSKTKNSSRQPQTFKQDCKSSIFIRLSKCQQYLKVVELNEEHNHKTSKLYFEMLSEQKFQLPRIREKLKSGIRKRRFVDQNEDKPKTSKKVKHRKKFLMDRQARNMAQLSSKVPTPTLMKRIDFIKNIIQLWSEGKDSSLNNHLAILLNEENGIPNNYSSKMWETEDGQASKEAPNIEQDIEMVEEFLDTEDSDDYTEEEYLEDEENSIEDFLEEFSQTIEKEFHEQDLISQSKEDDEEMKKNKDNECFEDDDDSIQEEYLEVDRFDENIDNILERSRIIIDDNCGK